MSQFNTLNDNQVLYRQLTYLPNHVAGLYGHLLKQTFPQWQNAEFDVTGWGENLAPALYFHSNYQNSSIKVKGSDANDSYRYGYTPMGQANGFKHRYSDEQMTRTFSSRSPNRNLVQNLYTGKYAEPLTGLVQMDARWYSSVQGRFTQGDQHNHVNLMLPKGAQSELMRYIGRNSNDLLRDPAQQMRFGYASGNAMNGDDPTRLTEYEDRSDNIVISITSEMFKPNSKESKVLQLQMPYFNSSEKHKQAFVEAMSDSHSSIISNQNNLRDTVSSGQGSNDPFYTNDGLMNSLYNKKSTEQDGTFENMMQSWSGELQLWDQSTGQYNHIKSDGSKVTGASTSGQLGLNNNPATEHQQYGTIPCGYYGVGPGSSFVNSNNIVQGRQLFPSEQNNMVGWSLSDPKYKQRDGLWLHGGNQNPSNSLSSAGCPIINQNHRNNIQTNTLMVVN